MMMKSRLALGVSLAAILLSMQACQKDVDTSAGVSTTSGLSASLIAASATVTSSQVTEASTEDVQSIALNKYDGTDSGANILGTHPKRDRMGHFMGFGLGGLRFDIPKVSDCATVTVSDSVYPKTVTVDYGTGCTGRHGEVKRGKIIIEISDSLVIAGSVKTVTYENFYIDSNQVALTATIRNNGKNAAGNWVVVRTSDQTVTKPNGEYAHETFTDTLEWTSGFETIDKADDVYYKSGAGSIVVNDTAVYNRITIKPLLVDRSCRFITSGIVQLVSNASTTTIDYGDGTCDAKASVTTNGTTEEIDLRSGGFGLGGIFNENCKGFGRNKGGNGHHGSGSGH